MLQYHALSNKVLNSLYSVHSALGPGLLESAYEGALSIELKHQGLSFQKQQLFPLHYRGELAGSYIADLVVEGKIILELKSVSKLSAVMEAQLINYLKLSGISVGYLVNFRGVRLEWKRFVVLKKSRF